MGFLANGALTALISAVAFGQAAQPPVARPSFEVVSVKPTTTSVLGLCCILFGGPGTPDPLRVIGRYITLMQVIRQAYEVDLDQIQGPKWLPEDRYEIVAKVPTGATKGDVKLMLQGMLEERFQLALHHTTKNLVAYELTIAKGGSKLKENHDTSLEPSRPGDPRMPLGRDGFPQLPAGKSGWTAAPVNGLRRVTSRGTPLSALVFSLQEQLGALTGSNTRVPARIVDKTGLTGTYDYNMEFVGDISIGALASLPAVADAQGVGPGLNFIEAMERQLGLKVTKTTALVDVLVIDHAERIPTEN